MNFWELIKARRSIREFDPTKKVAKEDIDKIISAGAWAPSAGNTQCWQFYVVTNEKVKEDLAIRAGHQPFLKDAQYLIVVCADLERIGRAYGARGRDTYALQDTTCAVENMLLAATALGLASCWIGAFDEGRAGQILKLKNGLRPVAILPIGYSNEDPTPPPRRPLNEVVVNVD